jgi:hypothetical protein
MRKICNNCGFQQNGFLNLGGRNYCNRCNLEIKSNNDKKQDAITVSAYEMEATYETLYETLEWLELYVEKTSHYPNWKKQMPKTITRTDIGSIDETRMKSIFSTSLFGLRNLTRNKPNFLLEKLKGEFHKWLDGSRINSDNCPGELAQCLLNVSEVLKGKGDEFAKARIKEVNERIEKMSKEERREKFNSFVLSYQEPLENEEERAKSREGQTYKDVNNEDKFSGDADKGKKTFELIKKRLEESQREVNRQRELEYLNQGDEMETDEFASSSSPAGGSNQNVSQQTFSAQPIRWDLIIDIGQNKSNWKVKSVVVSHNYVAGRWYQGQPELMLIHRTAKIEYNQANGDLIIQSGKMYKVKDFNDGERAELEQFFGSFQAIVSSNSQKSSFYESKQREYDKLQLQKDNKGVETGGVLAIIIVVSALLISSVIVAKKRLKVKK